jgi:hypothetical protein
MVRRAIDLYRPPAKTTDDAANVLVKLALNRIRYVSLPVLRAEHDVVIELRVRADHRIPPVLSPFVYVAATRLAFSSRQRSVG